MKKFLYTINIILLLTLISGCASIHHRSHYYKPPERYPGVQENLKALETHDSVSNAWGHTISFLSSVMTTLDIPLSFVLDTILLPYDLMRSPEEKNSKNTVDQAFNDFNNDKNTN